jgi:hypothetical protein
MTLSHTAREMALKSREYVHTHNKAQWLAMFAEDAIIQDPIGPSYLDPAGKGFSTPQEREAFWDNNIAHSNINITVRESYSVGNECANLLHLVIEFTYDGQRYRQVIDGVFTYEINPQGKLQRLRGYWSETENAKRELISA